MTENDNLNVSSQKRISEADQYKFRGITKKWSLILFAAFIAHHFFSGIIGSFAERNDFALQVYTLYKSNFRLVSFLLSPGFYSVFLSIGYKYIFMHDKYYKKRIMKTFVGRVFVWRELAEEILLEMEKEKEEEKQR